MSASLDQANDLTAWGEKKKKSEVFPQVDGGGEDEQEEKPTGAQQPARSRTPGAKRRLTCFSAKPKVHSNSKTRFSMDGRPQGRAQNDSCGLLQGNKQIHAVSLKARARSVTSEAEELLSLTLSVYGALLRFSAAFDNHLQRPGAHACARTMRLKGFDFPSSCEC